MPRLLRRVLCEVGNGGFGPGYGLLGLPPAGFTDDLGHDIVSSSMSRRDWEAEDPGGSLYWPHEWIVICHWGCAIYSCIDCSTDAAAVITCDPNGNWDELTFAKSHDSLEEWLRDWAEGKSLWGLMYEPVEGILRGPRLRPRRR